MSSPFGALTLIANPVAGRGRVRSRLPEIQAALDAQGLEHEVRLTEGPGDASRLAEEAMAKGCRFIVVAGGDGTVHEAVNGMVQADRALVHDAVLGVVAAGSGCDFIRTFGIPAQPVAAAMRLSGEDVRPLDLGKITYADLEGRPSVRYFVNIAEAGLGASTARRAETLPRWLGQARYLLAFWLTLPSYRPGTARIETGEGAAYEGRAVNIVMANCRFFGGGMEISPMSEADDGLLDVQVFIGPKTDSFTMIPKVYKGRHLPHRKIVQMRGARCEVSPELPLTIEADGEVIGTTPATVEMLPKTLLLKV